eukprot:gene20188-22163_t
MTLLDQDLKGLVIRSSSPLQMVDGSIYYKISFRRTIEQEAIGCRFKMLINIAKDKFKKKTEERTGGETRAERGARGKREIEHGGRAREERKEIEHGGRARGRAREESTGGEERGR